MEISWNLNKVEPLRAAISQSSTAAFMILKDSPYIHSYFITVSNNGHLFTIMMAVVIKTLPKCQNNLLTNLICFAVIDTSFG